MFIYEISLPAFYKMSSLNQLWFKKFHLVTQLVKLLDPSRTTFSNHNVQLLTSDQHRVVLPRVTLTTVSTTIHRVNHSKLRHNVLVLHRVLRVLHCGNILHQPSPEVKPHIKLFSTFFRFPRRFILRRYIYK